MKIATIGTCRTSRPLSCAARRFSFRVERGRNYGFVHTSREALQQLRFVLGAQDVPDHVADLAFRPGRSKDVYRGEVASPELFFVEISSRKALMVGDHAVQANYVARRFSRFLEDPVRARKYWSLASPGRLDERRRQFASDPCFAALSSGDQDLLSAIVRRDLTDRDIVDDLNDIVQLAGPANVVLVTHVNASMADGQAIEKRAGLISVIKSFAKKAQVACYDPTLMMRKTGQRYAMARDGADLAHYTDDFSERLGTDLYRRFVEPRSTQPGALPERPAGNPFSVPIIEAAWRRGEATAAFRKVHDALRLNPSSHPHRLLLARMQHGVGDFDGAIASLESARRDAGSGERPDEMLMSTYLEAGNRSAAMEMAAGLIADEVETFAVFCVCALGEEQVEAFDQAMQFWLRAFDIASAEERGVAVEAIFALLRRAGGSPIRTACAAAVSRSDLDARSFRAAWMYWLESGDRSELLVLADRGRVLPKHVAFDLVKIAAEHGHVLAAAQLASHCALDDDKYSEARTWLIEQRRIWLEEGENSLVEGRLTDAANYIQACRIARAPDASCLRAERALIKQIRVEVRAQLVARNYAVVLDFATFAAGNQLSVDGLDASLGRAAYELQNYPLAVTYLREATRQPEASIKLKTLLARAAAYSADFDTAIATYQNLLRDRQSDEHTRHEAERRLASLERKIVQRVRQFAQQGEFESGWNLLDVLAHANPLNPRLGRERKRLLSGLHATLRAIEAGDDSERLAVGNTILRLAPRDRVALKATAIACMHLRMFASALRCWKALREHAGSTESIESNIEKCTRWVERAQHNLARKHTP